MNEYLMTSQKKNSLIICIYKYILTGKYVYILKIHKVINTV